MLHKFAVLFLLLFSSIHFGFSQGFLEEIDIRNEIGYKKKAFKFDNEFDSIWLKSIDINDDDIMGFIERARNKMQYGFYKEASTDLEKAINLDSTIATPYLYKGIINLDLDSGLNAYHLFTKAIKYDNSDPLGFYYLGQSQITLDSLKQARNSFKTAIKLDPNFALGYFSLGNYYIMKPNLAKAKSFFKKAIEIDPNYAEAYTSKGIVELLLMQTGAALKTFDKATEVNPEFAGAYFMRGYIYIFRNKPLKVLSEWNKAINIDSINSFYRFARGALYINQKNFHLAYEDILKALRFNPIKKDRFKELSKRTSLEEMQALQTQVNIFESSKSDLNLEQVEEVKKCLGLFLVGKHKEVDIVYGKLIEKSPNSSLLFFLRGYNNEFRYDKTKSADYYKISLANSPKIDEANLRLGVIYNESGEHELAEQVISKYIEKNDSDCLAYRYRGISRVYLNKDMEALKDFNKFLSIDSTDWDILFNRAQIFSKLGRTKKAIQDYTSVIKLRPEDKESYYLRGICFYNTGDTAQAICDMDSSISIDKRYLNPVYSKAIINMERKNYEDAVIGFNNVLELNPHHPTALYHRAAIFYDTKKYEQALTDYNNILIKDSGNPDMYYIRGLTHFKLNHENEACEDFKKAVELGNKDAQKFIDKYCK